MLVNVDISSGNCKDIYVIRDKLKKKNCDSYNLNVTYGSHITGTHRYESPELMSFY